jgi:glutathione S-transferase
MGADPCGADAVIFAWVVSALWEKIRGDVRNAVADHPNLLRYRDRCMQRWFQRL